MKRHEYLIYEKGTHLPKIRSRSVNVGEARPRKNMQDVA